MKDNLFEIKNAINFLEAEKIKYNWSTYYDYENPPNKETAIDGILNSSTKQIYKDLNNTNRITKSLVNHIVETDSDFLENDIFWVPKSHFTTVFIGFGTIFGIYQNWTP